VLAVVLSASGCGDDGGERDGSTVTQGDITVFAAASLTDAFAEIGASFEAESPGTGVELNLGGSSALAAQIEEGAPGDVFASADAGPMEVVVAAGANSGPARPFATNRLQIAVPPGNPARVTGLADFGRDELLIGLCAEAVPCGALGRQVLERAGVSPVADTDERDVRALLTKLEAGELDAGLVYVTDVLASDGAVEGVDLPDEQNAVATYPIVALADSGAPEVAAAFVTFVLSAEGAGILARFGFGAP
jgi:molybdate transport system substrate-binding protein